MKAITKTRNVREENVEPGIVPVETLTANVESLKALGLPNTCAGGEILEDELNEDGETRWLVFRVFGMTLGVGYEVGPKPWGNATEVPLTTIDARKIRVGRSEKVEHVAAPLDARKVA